MTAFETVGLITKKADERVAATLGRLVAYLRSVRIDVLLDADSSYNLPQFDLPVVERDELGRRCDLVVVIAGDGTFLAAARAMVGHGVPLVGVNLGRLGFLTDIGPDEMIERFAEILAGHYVEERRFLLRCRALRDGAEVFRIDALNEIALHKWNIARLVSFDTFVDEHHVNSQRSDGLIVSTPTGSTAYALSGGGPILHPGLDAVVLVPVCPHTLTSRPLVVHGSSRIELVIGGDDVPEAQLSSDGASLGELQPADRVEITRRPEPMRMIHPPGYDYFATLRAKLLWSRGP